MFPSGSVVYDPKKDYFVDNPTNFMKWADHRSISPDGTGRYLNWNHPVPISNKDCQKALDYISVLVKPYPVQLRHAMARPLWERFCEAFCDTNGDLQSAMNAI